MFLTQMVLTWEESSLPEPFLLEEEVPENFRSQVESSTPL